MNKNTTASILTGIILTVASSAMAQSALQQLGSEASVDVAPMVKQMQALRVSDSAAAPVVALPQRAKDVFTDCSALDAKSFAPWNVSQAALMVQTCLNHAYAADGDYRVQASVARFGSRACPAGGAAACRAIIEVVGIKITVSGQIMTGDSVLLDLDGSLAARGGKLMGFETLVENQARLQN